MRTTMSIAYDALAERYSAVSIGNDFDSSAFACVVYDGLRVDAGRPGDEVYVLSDKAFADARGQLEDYVLGKCIVVVPPGELAPSDCAIAVSVLEPASAVVEALEDALLRYRRILKEMSSICLKGEDISQLVESAHKLLRNPILVHDAALRVKARTERDIMNDDLWTPLDSSLPDYSRNSLPEGLPRFIEQISSSSDIGEYKTPYGATAYSIRTKEVGGSFLVVSLLQKNKAVTDGDKLVLRELCRFIEATIKTSAKLAKGDLGFSGLLLDVLEGRIRNSVEFANRMSTLGYEVKAVANIIVVSPQKGEFSGRQAQRYIEDIFNTFPFGMGVHYKGHLVFLGTYDDARTVTSVDYARFEAFLGRFKMIAALGSPYPTNRPIKELYRNALANLRVGRKVYPDKRLLLSEDCQPYWAFEVCLTHGSPDLYIHPALGILRRHDLLLQDSLLDVLNGLAMNRGNRSAAAKDLSVQRNTLQSRIREIELICQIDLSDPATIDHIRCSFMMQSYCNLVDVGA